MWALPRVVLTLYTMAIILFNLHELQESVFCYVPMCNCWLYDKFSISCYQPSDMIGGVMEFNGLQTVEPLFESDFDSMWCKQIHHGGAAGVTG